jgi:hypothetical protein
LIDDGTDGIPRWDGRCTTTEEPTLQQLGGAFRAAVLAGVVVPFLLLSIAHPLLDGAIGGNDSARAEVGILLTIAVSGRVLKPSVVPLDFQPVVRGSATKLVATIVVVTCNILVAMKFARGRATRASQRSVDVVDGASWRSSSSPSASRDFIARSDGAREGRERKAGGR